MWLALCTASPYDYTRKEIGFLGFGSKNPSQADFKSRKRDWISRYSGRKRAQAVSIFFCLQRTRVDILVVTCERGLARVMLQLSSAFAHP
jgi:hypothetical protein